MRYDLIYMDPPWSFDTWGEKGNERSAESHYQVMSHRELLSLPIGQLAKPEAYVAMWCSWPYLEQGLALLEHWGFEYVTALFEWVKLNPSSIGFHMGTGYYTRANMEFCLLAKRGRPPGVSDKGVRKTIVTPVQEHSQKPHEAARRLRRLWPDLAIVELFATKHSAIAAREQGFDAWVGEDVSGMDIRLSIKNLLGSDTEDEGWLDRLRRWLYTLS